MGFGRRKAQQQENLFRKAYESYEEDNALFKSYEKQLSKSQRQIDQLSQQILKPPAAEAKQIESYKKAFLDKLKNTIQDSTRLSLSQTQSDLAKRFGGSINTTFGADLLGQIEKNKLQAMQDAQLEATQVGRELYDDAQKARVQKLNALMGVYDQVYSKFRDQRMLKETMNRYISQQPQQSPRRSLLGQAFSTVGRFALGRFFS